MLENGCTVVIVSVAVASMTITAGGASRPLVPDAATRDSQGGLNIISTTYISEIKSKRRKTLDMGIGKSLVCIPLLKRRLLK